LIGENLLRSSWKFSRNLNLIWMEIMRCRSRRFQSLMISVWMFRYSVKNSFEILVWHWKRIWFWSCLFLHQILKFKFEMLVLSRFIFNNRWVSSIRGIVWLSILIISRNNNWTSRLKWWSRLYLWLWHALWLNHWFRIRSEH